MKKVIALKEEISEKEEKIRKGCITYLKKACKKVGGEICTEGEEYTLIVTYDGGRHPEYNANPFSEVSSVFLKNNKIFLNTEDCNEYEIDRIDNNEVYDVAMFVYEMLKKG